MAILGVLASNWYENLQSLGLIVSLFFSTYTIRRDVKLRKVEHLMSITESHRAIWLHYYDQPELKRVLEKDPKYWSASISKREEIFVRSLILHLHTAFQSSRAGFYTQPEGIEADIRSIFTLPIPNRIWIAAKPYHDPDFVSFMEVALRPGK